MTEPDPRLANIDDVPAICAFGEAHIRPHYTPLIGAAAADDQVRHWWNEQHLTAAATAGLVLVTWSADGLVGVAQRGRHGDEHVIYKLYVAPTHRGRGLGPLLLDALVGQLPADAQHLLIEHFAANTRAGDFYEREGFPVDRIEPHPSGDPRLAVVWRSKLL